jgi:superfamily II DNA or RNA helicase
MKFNPGTLVTARNRDWVIQPSGDPDLILLKPLGGSEDEITAIYTPLGLKEDIIKPAEFPLPIKEDIGDLTRASILYNAARLSFRSGAGPFRSLAKVSFRPRSYQLVPMIMGLKQQTVRLLVADDVGVGKTLEALLIVKEMLERREISRFAIVCLPHLCDQWQSELKDKFDIDAVIIRSNTQARLDREMPNHYSSVYKYYPYQIISVDYIKSENRKEVFIHEAPEMIVVDEAHTCAKPEGASTHQQQRYSLLNGLAKKQKQHLILLTATPHSGKQSEFQSLLGLLNPEFETLDLPSATDAQKKKLADHFVQRRRADIRKWLTEETSFPERDSGEFGYDLSDNYKLFYNNALEFAIGLTQGDGRHKGKQRLKYFAALALLRGIMSSPAAGVDMLKNKIQTPKAEDEILENEPNPVLDEDYGNDIDVVPIQALNQTEFTNEQDELIRKLVAELAGLQNLKEDKKAAAALLKIKEWIAEGFNPVIFCRYIATAKYLGEVLAPELRKGNKDLDVQVITSEDPDEVRKGRIDDMSSSKKRVLIATDCLSEGINLQHSFTAVLHYDLPWNPNRLEQREGRVDRFGQQAPMVKAYLLYGNDNPIDGVVLKVILKKVKDIKRDIGISIPFPEDSKSVMDAVLNAVLLNPKKYQGDESQIKMDFGADDPVEAIRVKVSNAMDKAAAREKETQNIFRQHKINPTEIEGDLRENDEAIGTPKAVEDFTIKSLRSVLGVTIEKDKKGYVLFTGNLPGILRSSLPQQTELKVSFESPTPEGYLYLGRNHLFIEQLCHYLLGNAIKHDVLAGPARAAIERSSSVDTKTTLILFRVRNVIEEGESKVQLVAEEMLLWGYRGSASDKQFLEFDEAKSLMESMIPSGNLTLEAKADFLIGELSNLKALESDFNSLAEKRAEKLVDAHERFRKVLSGSKYKVVKPVLPMDILGVYILLPELKK